MSPKSTTPTELPPLTDTLKKAAASNKENKNAIAGASTLKGFYLEPEQVVVVGIDTTHTSRREHPLWDKRILRPVNEPLAESMMLYGFTTVVEVRKNGLDASGKEILEIVDGRQRTRAARLANTRLRALGRETIRLRAVYSRGEDSTLFGHRITANEHRAEDPPMDKARNYQQLLDLGRTEREAQVTFGISPQTAATWGRLLELDAKVQQAVDDGIVPASAAAELADLPRDEQVKKLEELVAAGGRITQSRVQQTLGNQRTSSSQSGRPKTSVLRRLVSILDEDSGKDDSAFECPKEDLVLLKWVTGEIDDDVAAKNIPWLKDAIAAASEKKKKSSSP